VLITAVSMAIALWIKYGDTSVEP